LIIYCFKSYTRIFRSYGDVTTDGEWLQILDLCSTLVTVEKRGLL
jgi:hypothetical protein